MSEDQKTNLPVTPLPENWREELAKAAAEASASESAQSRYISLKGGVMTFNGAAVPNNKIAVVVLDSIFERSYYENPYGGDAELPVCFAIVRHENELKPHANVEKKQSQAGCSTCDMSQWGSDPKGGKAQACKLRRRLSLIGEATLKQGNEAVLNGDAFGIKVPPTSTQAWASYVSQVANVVKRPPYGVVTVITARPHPKFMLELAFEFGRVLSEEELAVVMAKRVMIGDTFMAPWPSVEERSKEQHQKAEAGKAEQKAATSRARKY